MMWVETGLHEIADAVALLGGAMILLRFISLFALKRAGLYETFGKPAYLFFCDLLPFKLLRLNAPAVGLVGRAVFVTYAATYVGFLGAMVLMIISLSLR